jgi:hypothetical protein
MRHIFKVMPRGGTKIIYKGCFIGCVSGQRTCDSPDDKRTTTHARNAPPVVPLSHSTGSASIQYRG